MTEANWFQTAFGSEYIDLYAHRDDAEAAAVVELICRTLNLSPGTRVLDAPCGAGRHARAFAARGLKTVGLDLSPELLRKAAELNALVASGPSYIRADIRQLPFRCGGFALVTNLFSSFGYFHDEAENRGAMQGLVEMVSPGGHLVVDFMNAEHVERTLEARSERTTPSGWHVIEERWIGSEPKRINKRTVARGKHGEQREFRESVRLYHPAELEQMMREAGIVVTHRFGNYAGMPLTNLAPRALLIGEKK